MKFENVLVELRQGKKIKLKDSEKGYCPFSYFALFDNTIIMKSSAQNENTGATIYNARELSWEEILSEDWEIVND